MLNRDPLGSKEPEKELHVIQNKLKLEKAEVYKVV